MYFNFMHMSKNAQKARRVAPGTPYHFKQCFGFGGNTFLAMSLCDRGLRHYCPHTFSELASRRLCLGWQRRHENNHFQILIDKFKSSTTSIA